VETGVITIILVLLVHVPSHVTYPPKKNGSQRDINECFTDVFLPVKS